MYSIQTSIYALIFSFGIAAILCPVGIKYLKVLKFGQNVRDDGPQTHMIKAGTPTMGGIMILISMFFGSIAFINGNTEGAALLLITLGYGAIGFIDDYIKVVKKRSLGLRAYQKILLQLVVTTLFLVFLMNTVHDFTSLYIPFMHGKTIDLGIVYYPFFYIVVLGTVNAVNLTDGLDGLASGVTVLVSIFFGMMALYFDSGTFPISCAAIGSLLGFLLFNSYPAKVFMGDTGSLALGGFVAGISLILRMPLFILIVGLVYVVEALSVIIQVLYFKKTGGKRFFKMAPIHHHFEKSGNSETQIVTYFYIVTAILCLVGFLATTGI